MYKIEEKVQRSGSQKKNKNKEQKENSKSNTHIYDS